MPLKPKGDQPQWEQQLWSEPWTATDIESVVRLQQAYEQFRERNPNVPTSYADRYMSAWVRHNRVWSGLNGTEVSQGHPEGLGAWTPVGPTYVRDGQNLPSGEQANIYTLALAGAVVMYAGSEPGQVYRSTDQGQNWTLTALNVPFTGGIQALAGNPLNGQGVYAATHEAIYRTVDGGATWTAVRQASGLNPNELLVASHDTSLVYAATQSGLLRSIDRGATWSVVLAQPTYDVAFLPGGVPGRTVYALAGSGQERAVFYRSHTHGVSFAAVGVGWYQSTHPSRADLGGRIAVTPGDTNRVYAYLIGESKPGDNGFIGLYRSADRGSTWVLPRGGTGAPYGPTTPNTAIGAPGGTYHQGFYNCALAVHPANPDELLIGGLSLWKSTDGGATAVAMAGYASDSVRMHVDMQDFRIFPNPTGGLTTWISTDGGIYESTDFVATQPQVRMHGIQATEFWSLGQAWNEDVLVSGAYHNGVLARREAYPQGMFMQLGGGEPPSGYADPMVDGRVYSSEVGGVKLPPSPSASTPPQYFSFTTFPNESYWPSEASTMVFDPRSPSEILIGIDHKLMRSIDGGQSYQVIRTFGNDPLKKLGAVVQGFRQPEVIYVVQRQAWSPVQLHRSLDSGATWTTLVLPSGVGSRMVLAVDPAQALHVVAAFPDAPNGQKVYRTTNGGQLWAPWSSPALNNHEVRAVVRLHGASPSWAVGTNHDVFVRYDTGTVWLAAGLGLPHPVQTRDLAAHYGLGKLRIATYGRGMWECDIPNPALPPLAQPMVSKRIQWRIGCAPDSVRFASRSIVLRAGTTYDWSFPGGAPATSNAPSPAVFYAQPGAYTARLRLANQGFVDSALVSFRISAPTGSLSLADFEGSVFPDPHIWVQNEPGGTEWRRAEWTTGNHAARADNYYHDAQGASSDLVFSVEHASLPEVLRYRYAYAPYGPPYSDTLVVLISPNCDLTAAVWADTLGGSRLQSAPQLTSAMFVPSTPSDWKNDSIPFTIPQLQSALQANQRLYVGFRNIGRYGQALYLDSLELVHHLSSPEVPRSTAIEWMPNPVSSGAEVRSWPKLPESAVVEWFTASGKRLGESAVDSKGHTRIPAQASGLVLWRVRTDDRAWAGTLVVL